MRASMFGAPGVARGTTSALCEEDEVQGRLSEARESLDIPGEYLLYGDGDDLKVVGLTREWTRIGRSLAADIRFDDPTVSRRHALIVRQPDGVRLLDDRSLNGVFVNGSRVEWSPLRDGDEIVVGRHLLHYVAVTREGLARSGENPLATLG